MKETADAMEDAGNNFQMPPPTIANTTTTEKKRIGDPAITFSSHKSQPPIQSADGISGHVKDSPQHPPPRPNNTACLSTQKELTAPTKILMLQPTTQDHPTQHNTTLQLTNHNQASNPGTTPDCTKDLAPDPANTSRNQCYLDCPTTAWICETYAPVFQSIACLENLATRLFDKMSLLLNKQNTDTAWNPTRFTLTPHQNPLHPTYKPIQSQQQHFIFPPLSLPTA